jgi:hypothetical protein
MGIKNFEESRDMAGGASDNAGDLRISSNAKII